MRNKKTEKQVVFGPQSGRKGFKQKRPLLDDFTEDERKAFLSVLVNQGTGVLIEKGWLKGNISTEDLAHAALVAGIPLNSVPINKRL